MTQTILNQRIEEFFSSKGKTLIFLLASLAILVFAIFQFFVPSKDIKVKEYLNAKVQLQRLSYQKEGSDEVLKELQNSFLANENEGIIAQNLAFQGKWDQVYLVAEKNIEKFLPKDSAIYNYSKASLLIEKKQFASAIKSSVELQKNIEDNPSLGLLSAYNFVRLNFLIKYADEQDKQLIGSFIEKFKANPSNNEYLNMLEDIFKDGNSRLSDFLKITKLS